MTTLKDVFVPDIGDFKEIPVIEVLVKPGDVVEAEDSIITLESDKATMEVPAPTKGVVKEIKVNPGDTVSEGSLILSMESPQAENIPQEKIETRSKESSIAQGPKVAQSPEVNSEREYRGKAEKDNIFSNVSQTKQVSFNKGSHASPSVRKFARELGVDLSKIEGSGLKNRILKEDIQEYIKKSLMQSPSTGNATPGGKRRVLPDFTKFGGIEKKPLSRIKKISGPLLQENWQEIPHVTQHHEVDVTELENFRKKIALQEKNIKITPVSFVIKALSVALTRNPSFNSSLNSNGNEIILKKYINIGVAVDTPNGLLVPVIKNVLSKGILEIAEELNKIGEKARNGKLTPKDMEGGTFSVSSLGGVGGGHFTPIVNFPEVAILGINRAQIKPVWDGSQFSPKNLLPLSLSYDHRVIDGAEGARFIVELAELLKDLRNTLL